MQTAKSLLKKDFELKPKNPESFYPELTPKAPCKLFQGQKTKIQREKSTEVGPTILKLKSPEPKVNFPTKHSFGTTTGNQDSQNLRQTQQSLNV